MPIHFSYLWKLSDIILGPHIHHWAMFETCYLNSPVMVEVKISQLLVDPFCSNNNQLNQAFMFYISFGNNICLWDLIVSVLQFYNFRLITSILVIATFSLGYLGFLWTVFALLKSNSIENKLMTLFRLIKYFITKSYSLCINVINISCDSTCCSGGDHIPASCRAHQIHHQN